MDQAEISIRHDGDKISHLSESCARDLLERARRAIADGAIAEARGDGRATIEATMGSTKGAVHCEWDLAGARIFADGLERALALREASHNAKGQPIGKTDRIIRDPVTLEATGIETIFQY
jgi:hypothetical protein